MFAQTTGQLEDAILADVRRFANIVALLVLVALFRRGNVTLVRLLPLVLRGPDAGGAGVC